MIELDRGQFLRLGAGGLAAATAAGMLPSAARAGLPIPAPQDDDVAFFAFATVAERASRDFYRAAYGRKGSGLSARERRRINAVASAKRAHILRLDKALGADAPASGDFETVLPPGVLKTRARMLTFAARLETLLIRTYLNGVSAVADPASRLLLGRMLAYDSQVLTWLQLAGGKASPAGLQGPLDLELAAAQLDRYLSTPDFKD